MPSAPTAIDERLQELLSIEQRLEARLTAAQTEAAAQVASAKEKLIAARQATLTSIAGRLEAEAKADGAAHEAALEAIRVELDEALARFAAVTDDELDRLARKALDRVLERGGDR